MSDIDTLNAEVDNILKGYLFGNGEENAKRIECVKRIVTMAYELGRCEATKEIKKMFEQ